MVSPWISTTSGKLFERNACARPLTTIFTSCPRDDEVLADDLAARGVAHALARDAVEDAHREREASRPC